MSIITITSDLGTSDHYLASLKGALFSQIEDLNIIDISNDVEKYNLLQAAYILKHSCLNFPKGTIHIVMIGIHSAETDYLIVKFKDQFFIGLDNGLFSIAFENEPIFAYRIKISAPPEMFSFPELAIIPPSSSHLLRGGVPEVIAEPVSSLKQMLSYAPVIQGDQIRASVIYIDSYGNLITNLDKATFNRLRRDRNFEIRFRNPHVRITKISTQYGDVDTGNPLALFNSANNLEVAIHMGKASGLIGVSINDSISISFK